MTTASSPRITVAIVEDDKTLQESLAALLMSAPNMQFIGACSSGEEALRKIPGLAPMVVIMDINMGAGMDGVECVRRLKDQCPGILVIMFTIFDDGERLFESLKAGASGYLLKRTPADKLLEAITDVVDGGSPMSSGMARQVVDFFHQGKGHAVKRPTTEPMLGLAPREEEVLALLAKGLLLKQIAHKLGLSYDTVRSYMRDIYTKMHVHSRTEAVLKYLER
jgi:DNA-binding NarL/FixJ family response regulator